ncbi:unnamed protein product [Ambrosiozyma monospora]|uniref:Unnamed protein product n=1 Tax=Ambrosiozyma monospora TaxID=43982 RepID=A0ACB5TZB3_AMBMO|nr:unnamed protein product [Ambrosiozyma monospora]
MDPNEGSVAAIDTLYMWLRNVPDLVYLTTDRHRAIFGYVIKLIKFLKIDVAEAYNYFGFMFADEYELLSYLEK